MSIDKKLFDLKELITANGGPIPLSRSGIYSAAAKGLLPTVSIGRRLFVPSWYVDRLLMPPKKMHGA
jgi:hypothetical protein